MGRGRSSGARRSKVTIVAAITALAAAALAGLALASTTTTLKVAKNFKLSEKIVVDSKGLTLYELKAETTQHLLCKNAACFAVWPPYKVSRTATLTKASGIKGKLGKLHRNGFYQVTLSGWPLYHYSVDNKTKGRVKGNGIPDFGTKWRVIKVGVIYGTYP